MSKNEKITKLLVMLSVPLSQLAAFFFSSSPRSNHLQEIQKLFVFNPQKLFIFEGVLVLIYAVVVFLISLLVTKYFLGLFDLEVSVGHLFLTIAIATSTSNLLSLFLNLLTGQQHSIWLAVFHIILTLLIYNLLTKKILIKDSLIIGVVNSIFNIVPLLTQGIFN
ncbi:hypothetical protein [Lactococcus termiticola]|uniref:Uncharacterized protein n=1 Tax=Lactococcus termiticola TaxID=2169526 RepID=A0A2R5HD25_9LACT|nr:hypothetical protein [Lactococcus termiticola]GBG95977.1 hypothetical protein NtB2_00079 [Lactococcus termiticola]